MTRKSMGIFAVVVLVLAAAAAYYFLAAPRMAGTAQPPAAVNPVHYQTALVKKGNFADTIQSTGTIRSNQTATLTWQTSGTVKTVGVSRGQVVSAKTVLAELERATMPQVIILAQADLVTAQKALDNLLTSSQARANAELALIKAQQALDDANKARQSKEFQRASPETIDIAQANLISANDMLDKAEKIFNRNSNRDDKDVVYAAALAQYAKARQLQTQAQYNYDYVRNLPDPLDLQEAEAKVTVAQANLLQAKTDWERIKDGPNDQDVAAAQARVDAAQAAINMGHIIAPFQGTLTQAVSKVGDQVSPNTVAFQIDDLSHLYVDVAVAEIDIARVKLGQPVSLTLDALGGKRYAGKVTDIASVGKNTASTVNFMVTVEISQPSAEIKPGMTVAASIAVSQTQAVLSLPSSAIQSHEGAQGGEQIVYLLKDGAPIPVVVLPGDPLDGGDTAILKGAIKEGDQVITNPSSIP